MPCHGSDPRQYRPPSSVPYGAIVTEITCTWRGPFGNDELNALHAEAFDHSLFDDDWQSQLNAHALGWVTARAGEELVGFVYVIWDGLIHAWIQDVIVSARLRQERIGTRIVAVATEEARTAGCEWLHVDFDEELAPFYFEACGFTPTSAGLINLREP